jgi:hypothetical protein
MAKTSFNACDVRLMFEQRLDSLDNDTKRCFAPIDGLQFAPFPAVLYAFSTVDYFSSAWKGWNDPVFGRKKKKRRNQTKRLVAFLARFIRYGKKESQIAVSVWRHKLMHTGEPRLVRNKTKTEKYGWEISYESPDNMKLVPVTGGSATHKLVLNPLTLAKDLREAVFGAGRYWDQLQDSILLQARFLRFRNEIKSYTIELYR